ncbi:MAG: site-specific integrase [Tolypothrix carrinoi HA7290-LM1]|jgi:integrase|nr:site-specific integrase [Tolypothrix carrinoi HA7290-LM1]
MKVQKIRTPYSDRVSWLVLDEDYLPIEPIQRYLRYLESIERSPNTIRAYAGHLKLFWEFLASSGFDWKDISLDQLADFIHWLRKPEPKVISIQPLTAKRTERTVNTIISAVCSFYDFQHRLGNTQELPVYTQQFIYGGRSYKPFMHHITKGKPVQRNLLKLKETRQRPLTLTVEQVKQLIQASKRLRDKFLICLLYETGIRIGQALGLRHEDIHSWDNLLIITKRTDNANGARAKNKDPLLVHVSKELMTLYSDYLLNEYPEDKDSDYVFVNIWEGQIGQPMTYSTVSDLCQRLQKVTGIKLHPHMFRHTHATELIRSGWDMSYVQKRLGHVNVQTTVNTYVHLQDDDLQAAYQKYLEKSEYINATRKE